jgi:hypothetical protein
LADTIEKRVGDLEQMVWDIPRLINIRFDGVRDQLNAQSARLDAQSARLDAQSARLDAQGARLATLEGKIDALPRVLAEMLTEMLDERERRKS